MASSEIEALDRRARALSRELQHKWNISATPTDQGGRPRICAQSTQPSGSNRVQTMLVDGGSGDARAVRRTLGARHYYGMGC